MSGARDRPPALPAFGRLERAAIVLLGVDLVGTGLRHLAVGEWVYRDLVALVVPSPLAVAAGLLLLRLAWITRAAPRG